MQWPQRPTCHGLVSIIGPIIWRGPDLVREPSASPYRTCNYCGSINVEDFMRFCNDPALEVKLDMADWKYGWPHKFYVDGIPNPHAGKLVNCGSHIKYEGGVRTEEPIMEQAPMQSFTKLYTEHLADEGYDDEALLAICTTLGRLSSVDFFVKNGEIKYRRRT